MIKAKVTRDELRDTCRFCYPPDHERILLKTPNFYVMLSLGPILEGHLLIISNEHIECCADFQGEIADEFDSLLDDVNLILYKEYGRPILFEHGRTGSSISGDTHCYHAHMHCVPTNVNLTGRVESDFPGKSLKSIEELRYMRKKCSDDYLFVADSVAKKVFFPKKEIKRQYLRFKLANALGVDELADWLEVPGWCKIMRAREKLIIDFAELGIGKA